MKENKKAAQTQPRRSAALPWGTVSDLGVSTCWYAENCHRVNSWWLVILKFVTTLFMGHGIVNDFSLQCLSFPAIHTNAQQRRYVPYGLRSGCTFKEMAGLTSKFKEPVETPENAPLKGIPAWPAELLLCLFWGVNQFPGARQSPERSWSLRRNSSRVRKGSAHNS